MNDEEWQSILKNDIFEVRNARLPRYAECLLRHPCSGENAAPSLFPRTIVICLALASMLFSTNSATALSGLLWDSAMIRIAFQLSPILSFPELFAAACFSDFVFIRKRADVLKELET